MNSQTHLMPLKGAARRRPFVVCDIESKHEGTQDAGFTRPFLVGGYAGRNVWGSSRMESEHYHTFRNEPSAKYPLKGPIRWNKQHLLEGGCVDRFFRWILGRLTTDIQEAAQFDYESPEENCGFRGLIIYAHNGGGFDYLHLLPWLAAHPDEFEFTTTPMQSSIQEIQVKRRDDKHPLWYFRDSMKLLPLGLDRAAKTFGLEGKKEHSLDLPEDDPLWDSYLKQDCLELDKIMEKVHELVEDKLGGSVGMTAPSTSMNLFRRRFLKRSIPRHVHFDECPEAPKAREVVKEAEVIEEPEKLEEETVRVDEEKTEDVVEKCEGCCQQFFRDGYSGGRTELFRFYGENLRYYDINSSYVAALCQPMPVGERFVDYGKIDWRLIDADWVGFAECEVEIPEDCYIPPLPYKDGKLMFKATEPGGKTLKAVWDVAELALLDHPRVKGKILSVGRVVWMRAKPIFREMMLELYNLRDKSRADYDEGMSLIAKLLGNGLYGKFGQRKERTQIVAERPRLDGECFLCGEDIEYPRQFCRGCIGSKPAGNLDSGYWYQLKNVDAQYIMPQISAHVTALARIRLFEFNMMALDRGGKIYMNDTDSLITDVEMPTSTELGALKDEYPGDLLRFIGVQPKVYLLEKMGGGVFGGSHLSSCTDKKNCKGCAPWKVAMKGFPQAERTKENLMGLKEDLENGGGGRVVTFERLEKVRSMAAKGFREAPRMIQVQRSFKSPYSKRRVLPNGDTMPMLHQ